MKLLLVAATRTEIEPLSGIISSADPAGTNPRKCFFKGLELDVLVTGTGIAATSFLLGKQYAASRYDFALNLGVAGSFESTFRPGEIVHVVEDQFADLGAEDGEKFLSVFEIGLEKKDSFPFQSGSLKNNAIIKNQVLNNLRRCRGVTVNTVHGNSESIRKFLKRTNPEIESMEGAAFFYASFLENISCAQIRAVSNFVEARNKEHWNLPLAIANLNKKAVEILNAFS